MLQKAGENSISESIVSKICWVPSPLSGGNSSNEKRDFPEDAAWAMISVMCI